MHMKKSYWYALLVLLLLGGGYFWYHRSQTASKGTQYVTAKAEKGTLTTSISSSGNITIDSEANVDPTISGTVINLSVKVGDTVKKGDLLFQIDNDDLSVSVAKSRASYLSAQQSLTSAKANHSQAKSDYYDASHGGEKSSQLSQSALKKKSEAAGIGVTAAEQSLAAARLDYNNQLTEAAKRRVTAPIDGTVNEVNIKNGDDLGSLSSSTGGKVTPIIIGDLGTLQVSVDVSEVDITSISLGQKVEMTLDAIPGLNMTGKVSAIDSLGTNSQGVINYTVTLDLDSLDPRLKPGMSVSASIITGVKMDVLLVPNSAVKSDTNGKYVQILENGAPVKKSVTVGASNATETEIKSGLNPGEAVVTQTITANAASTTSTTPSGNPFRAFGGGGGAAGGGNRGGATSR